MVEESIGINGCLFAPDTELSAGESQPERNQFVVNIWFEYKLSTPGILELLSEPEAEVSMGEVPGSSGKNLS